MKSLHSHLLPAGRTAGKLAAIAGGLILVHIVVMQLYINDDLEFTNSWRLDYWHIAMFDLDEEEAFGTWFSAMLLLLTGRLLLVATTISRAAKDGIHAWWLVLAIGFHFLSVDEVAGMHEYLNTLMDESEAGGEWTDIAVYGLGAVALAFLPFLYKLPRRTAGLFIVAGLLYAGGAVGVERWTGGDVNSLSYNMWTAFEEGLEMSGVIAMIYAVLDHLRGTRTDVVRVDVGRVAADSVAT